eukprot:3903813-Pleurochrysis_carterae.AAC.4
MRTPWPPWPLVSMPKRRLTEPAGSRERTRCCIYSTPRHAALAQNGAGPRRAAETHEQHARACRHAV